MRVTCSRCNTTYDDKGSEHVCPETYLENRVEALEAEVEELKDLYEELRRKLEAQG